MSFHSGVPHSGEKRRERRFPPFYLASWPCLPVARHEAVFQLAGFAVQTPPDTGDIVSEVVLQILLRPVEVLVTARHDAGSAGSVVQVLAVILRALEGHAVVAVLVAPKLPAQASDVLARDGLCRAAL